MLTWWTCVWCPNDSSYIWCSRRSCGRLSAETLQTSSQCGRPFLWPPFQRPSGLPKGIHHIWSRHRSSLLISGCPTLSLKATSSLPRIPRICRANLGRISSFEPISIYIYYLSYLSWSSKSRQVQSDMRADMNRIQYRPNFPEHPGDAFLEAVWMQMLPICQHLCLASSPYSASQLLKQTKQIPKHMLYLVTEVIDSGRYYDIMTGSISHCINCGPFSS